ncbi:MAG TPA: response regulator transcription factor [Candidatus Limnocylindria bacterium]|jgi:DNA-binding NarL/FixJ family response regulator|nr:response regulator transcription factor [Candidatus Limnocylindria bacterium]
MALLAVPQTSSQVTLLNPEPDPLQRIATSPPRETPIKVAVVEDDPGYRDSLANLFLLNPDFQLVNAFNEVDSCLRELRQQPADVVLMDIQLPNVSGIDGVRRLLEFAPKTLVVMLTSFDDGEKLFESLRAGAVGYLIKRATADEILTAVRDAVAGGSPISSRLARLVVRSFHGGAPAASTSAAPTHTPLSAREKELLDLLAEGLRYKEAADRMGVSLNTIRCYIRRVYEKLHANSRVEAIRRYGGTT